MSFSRPLTKLKSNPKPESIGTFDIESNNWTQFEMAGTFNGYEFIKHDAVKDLLDYIFESPFRSKKWYAHNGGRFDFLFLLEHLKHYTTKPISLICMGSSITGITVKRDSRRHTHFRDSFALLPHSLDALSKSFETSHQKQTGKIDFDRERVSRDNPTHIEYLRHDCQSLYEILDTFQRMPLIENAGLKISLASTALAAWRSTLETDIHSTSAYVQNFVRQSYAGGRCEIFKMLLKDGFCYDVNSLYPSMLLKPLPHHYMGPTKDVDEFGFHSITAYVPKDSFPILWSKTPKLIFPTGYITGTFFSEEIKLAVANGAKIIRHHEGHHFLSSDLLFKEFVDTCYDMRLKNPTGPKNMTAKLLMNATYGKLGEKELKKSLYIVNPDAPHTWPKPPYSQWRSPAFFKKYGMLTKEVYKRQAHMQVHIASAVTAYGRIHMAKNFYIPYRDEIAYTDTDSVYLKSQLPEGIGLGALKKEYSIKSAAFILPKGYYIETQDGKIIRKLKGFSKKFINSLNRQDFNNRSFNSTEKSKLLTFREALIRKNEFLATADKIKSLKAIYDKREMLPNGDTRAWHFEKPKTEERKKKE